MRFWGGFLFCVLAQEAIMKGTALITMGLVIMDLGDIITMTMAMIGTAMTIMREESIAMMGKDTMKEESTMKEAAGMAAAGMVVN